LGQNAIQSIEAKMCDLGAHFIKVKVETRRRVEPVSWEAMIGESSNLSGEVGIIGDHQPPLHGVEDLCGMQAEGMHPRLTPNRLTIDQCSKRMGGIVKHRSACGGCQAVNPIKCWRSAIHRHRQHQRDIVAFIEDLLQMTGIESPAIGVDVAEDRL